MRLTGGSQGCEMSSQSKQVVQSIDIIPRREQLQGEFLRDWTMPDIEKGTPTGCSFDANNHLIVADTHYHRIIVFDIDGKQLQQFGRFGEGPGEMVYPTDVVRDKAGNYYVTEYGHTDRVLKFSPAGKFIKQWGRMGSAPGEFHRPMSIAIENELLLVADSSNHRVQLFDLEGNLIRVIGEPGKAPGQFKFPYDVALDQQGRIYVCEYGNNRIQCFSPEGEKPSSESSLL